MIIKRLRLRNFRNYEAVDCSFEPGLNLIVGENAQGKTNILEAVYSACTGRSFRTRDDNDMIKFQNDFSKINLEFFESNRDMSLDITLLKNKSKEIRFNRIPIRTYGELIGKAMVIVFSPDDLRLVKEGPQERRRFMDREISSLSPIYYEALLRYHKVLKQRNKLLKTIRYNTQLKETLEHWDNQLCSAGYEIIKGRLWFVDQISSISKELHSDISDGRETLAVQYMSFRSDIHDIPCGTIAESMKSKLSLAVESDILRGTTSVGPHRDDFVLKINNMDLKDYGSQGQHRSAALALKLSGIEMIRREVGRLPVVLLDDVMSELDTIRQNALLISLSDAQILMTATDTANLDKVLVDKANKYIVKNGYLLR